jgi:hypothetical protein
MLDVKLIDEAPWNYKTNDDTMQAKLRANIARNGQLENLIVRPMKGGRFESVNGNHRLREFLANGTAQVMVYDLGEISQVEAERIAIETNETRFGVNELRLGEALKRIGNIASFADLEATMPFSAIQMRELAALADFDFSKFNEKNTVGAQGNLSGEVTKGESGEQGPGWRTVAFRVPEAYALEWEKQLERVMRALNPEAQDLLLVPYAPAIEIMLRLLAAVPSGQLLSLGQPSKLTVSP